MPALAHSARAPSSASRWTVCTASVGFIAANEHLLPPDTSSPEADEGTRAHAYADALFNGGDAQPDNPEMERIVQDYVQWVKSAIRPEDSFWTERRVPLFYLPDERGTVDATIWAPDRIVVRDLKYGKGVSVDAVNNKQLAIYAESVIRLIELVQEVPIWVPVIMEIYQPRDRANPEAVRTWQLSRDELRRFCMHINTSSIEIETESNLQFHADPDTTCRWCRAKGICKHYGAHGLSVVSDEPVEVAVSKPLLPPDPRSLTREQRIRIIQARKALEDFLEAVENQEVAELMSNAPHAGFKLVEGKANRKWGDEEAAEKLLRNYLPAAVVRPPGDLISPAAAEALLKKETTSTKFDNKLALLITRPSGKPTLVPESDKRPALNFDPTKELSNLEYEII